MIGMIRNRDIKVEEEIKHLSINLIIPIIISRHRLRMILTMKNDNKIDNFY
jgi:hypothetical protein